MPTFTAQNRLDITRRQINIIQENQAYMSTQASLNDNKQKLLGVDNANKVFYNIHDSRAESYENEGRAMNGSIPAVYSEGVVDPYSPGDLSTSAKSPGGTLFFPSATPPATAYPEFIPFISNSVNGFLHPTGTDARYELNILSNAVVIQGLTEMIFRLNNGITGASNSTTITVGSIPSGTISAFSLTVNDTTGFSANDLLYISQSSLSGIYKIITVDTLFSMTIDSVVPTSSGLSGGSSVKNTVVAFTNTERQTLVSSTYQEILTNITNTISSLIGEWEGKLDSELSILTANNEDRSPYTTQNASEISAINATKLIIDTWQALPNTGVTGKYTSASIAPISAEITSRQSVIASRLAQIGTALGNVSQSGSTYNGVVGSPYYERYKWLNTRINKASGSARRFFAADDGVAFLGTLASDNTSVKGEYDSVFLTKAITFLDGSNITQVSNVTSLSVGDVVTVVSETQPEIQRAVMSIMGTTQIKLDLPIPNTYTVADKARLFKQLS